MTATSPPSPQKKGPKRHQRLRLLGPLVVYYLPIKLKGLNFPAFSGPKVVIQVLIPERTTSPCLLLERYFVLRH